MDDHTIYSLQTVVLERYALTKPTNIHLLRSYTNDVYAVRSATGIGLAVLKLYGSGWRTIEDVLYEVDLLRHLDAAGCLVSVPIADRRDHWAQPCEIGGERRIAVLFSYIEGARPTPPFTADLYIRFGKAAANLHNATDGYTTTHQRRPIDTELLLDEPTLFIAPLIESDEIRNAFLDNVAGLKRSIESLVACGLDWGPCHGDLSLDNLHVLDDGRIALFDFDSGGPGWRAMDLPGWARFVPEGEIRAEAFYRGYRSVRSLGTKDVHASPYLFVAGEVLGMHIDLTRRVVPQGAAATRTYIENNVARVARMVKMLEFS